jgi:dTDP-4-amino-4,6-dideoxygalactose transaminase
MSAPDRPAADAARDAIPLMTPWFGAEESAAAAEVLSSGWVAQGPRVAEFEAALCEKVDAVDGVAVSSGTAGLHLAMVVLGVGPGDEVIVPSLSYIASANAPRYVGASVVFADVDPRTQNLTPATIEARLSPLTRAVVLVHQAGVPADLDAVHALCDRRGIAVVEDAACALGATYRDRPIGGHSDLVVFSFHPRKLITTGEGGMVLTSRPEWAERLRRLRDHGSTASAVARHAGPAVLVEQYVEVGYNYRLSDLQAAIGLVQLTRLDAIVGRRRALADDYFDGLRDIAGLETIGDPPYGQTNFQSFWVVLPDGFPQSRDELLEDLWRAGISARRGIMAAHREPTFAGQATADLPETERLCRRSVVLPLFHAMTGRQQDRVVEALRRRASIERTVSGAAAAVGRGR